MMTEHRKNCAMCREIARSLEHFLSEPDGAKI